MIASIIPVMVPLQVRPGDCDSFGHVNNAVYVSFVQQALAATLTHLGLAADWQVEGDHLWQMRSLSAEYRYATRYGEDLEASLWLEIADPLQPVIGCEIRSSSLEPKGVRQVKVRTRSTWVRLARATGKPAPVPAAVLGALPAQAGAAPKVVMLPAEQPDIRSYAWRHDIMRFERDPFGFVQLPAIYHWLEEAVFDASAQAGWPMERWRAAGYFTLQIRHDTVLTAYPQRQESITIASRLIDMRRLRGTWCVDLYRYPGHDLLIRDYSTGVFLDLEGRPATLPAQIGRDIQFGAESAPL
jgi:acyl-CoA thioester hydrolase